ncbi:MAG: radical SAM protein [Bacteroidales bacterium]|nr:radical SAM protein [Bacteroidales bacterium]
MSFLFHDIVFGPVKSRRLGVSLGVNLLPVEAKYCTFNCIYCECGWTHEKIQGDKKLPTRELVRERLEKKLKSMKETGMRPDAITFAGNGEPTIHPQFPEIFEDAIQLRDQYFPEAKVSVLSNASTLDKPAIFQALKKSGNSILKLDAGTEKMFRLINSPRSGITLHTIIEKLKEFNGELIIQTLFLRGIFDGKKIDNTVEPEISRWLEHIRDIGPKYVMIYPIDRETPSESLEKISFAELGKIADRIESLGIKAQVYY